MKKSLTMAMALALGVTASAYAANPFSDVPQGHWAYASVAQLAADGVVDGYADGAFAGDKLITRYEMAQIVAKAMANGAKVDTTIGVVKATAGYTVFKEGKNYDDFLLKFDNVTIDFADETDMQDNKIWNVGVAFDLAKDLSFTADYLKSNIDGIFNEEDGIKAGHIFDGDDGIVLGLNYKGAKASEPGSYGLYANYYDQARGTVIAHTMNGAHGSHGFKGYMVGANYTLAKNIVAALEWYDLKGKSLKPYFDGDPVTISEKDMETLWAQVVFTF